MRARTKGRIFAVVGLSIIALVIGLVIYVGVADPDRWVNARW